MGTVVAGAHSLGREVPPFNPPPHSAVRTQGIFSGAQSLGRLPCDPAPLGTSGLKFPQGLTFPLPLTPSIPKCRSQGACSRGGCRICPSVCLSGWVGGRLSPDGSLTAPGRSYITHRGQGLGGHRVGGPCWRRCRTGWGHQGTATDRKQPCALETEHCRAGARGGGRGRAGGRRRGLASFAGQRFQPCPPPPCASGVGRGFLPTWCWPESPYCGLRA